ncbi:gamma-glutamyltranspeptidase [Plectosphaerella plurivora]|uniref:Glutathione hydrolase n=1 Tax=Plectosphaerella plurivora TaxID=936078 RepID=A0A9P8VJP5_9PEZI|nr:gamma-glutamyltranspeptidase [Plectosphaerella plurivora]
MKTTSASRLPWPLLLLSQLPGSAGSAIPQVVMSGDGYLGAVASERMECTKIGRDLLAGGGNAVDAMVGTQLCVGVTSMYHSGIGGGGFALVRDAKGNYESVDFRESAPAAASEDMYKDNVQASIFGGLAAGVPSELRGLEYLHQKHGALPWADVVMPASKLAIEGFAVNEDMVRYFAYSIGEIGYNFLVDDKNWAMDFAPNGTLLGLNDVMTRKRYGETLATIAKEGPGAFYNGKLAASFVDTVQQSGGIMTLDDMSSYAVNVGDALSTTYRGYRLFSSGAPASGAICLNILKILEQFDPADGSDTNLAIHRLDEAMRFAYGARVLLGDPDFVDDMSGYQASLLDETAAKAIRSRIHDDRTLPVEAYDPSAVYTTESHGTSHVVTADSSGIAVSLTSTVNLLFGAMVVDPLTGVILNNEMNDFSIPGVRNAFGFEPSSANFIRPGKRPLSSINPVIVERPDGTLYVTVGAAGGSRITSSTAQIVWRILEHNATMGDALRQPRVHDQLMPNNAFFEYSFDNDTVSSMRERGHNVTWIREGLSAVQGIRILDGGVFEAASEPRQRNSGALSL